jgi:hypothetical protein
LRNEFSTARSLYEKYIPICESLPISDETLQMMIHYGDRYKDYLQKEQLRHKLKEIPTVKMYDLIQQNAYWDLGAIIPL